MTERRMDSSIAAARAAQGTARQRTAAGSRAPQSRFGGSMSGKATGATASRMHSDGYTPRAKAGETASTRLSPALGEKPRAGADKMPTGSRKSPPSNNNVRAKNAAGDKARKAAKTPAPSNNEKVRTAAKKSREATAKPRRQRRAGLGFLAMVAVLVVAALVIRSRTFVLGEVRVEGNEAYTDSQIAAMSGLKIGESIFSVNENAIARSFSTSSDVKLLDVRVDLPDTVTLVVSERKARAAVNCAGVILIVDEEGQIMQRMSSVPESGVIVVSGLDVSVNAQGRKIESAKTWQLRDMKTVLTALEARGMMSVMSELNLSDRYNIYLVSTSGVQIMLGDEENIPDKLVWAQAVLEKLTQEGVRRGILDVSTGRNAVYADR